MRSASGWTKNCQVFGVFQRVIFDICVHFMKQKKPHENPAIGIILCKDMNKAFVDFVIRDYSKPMGVATYKTSKDMSDELKKALPDIDDLKKLLGTDE